MLRESSTRAALTSAGAGSNPLESWSREANAGGGTAGGRHDRDVPGSHTKDGEEQWMASRHGRHELDWVRRSTGQNVATAHPEHVVVRRIAVEQCIHGERGARSGL